MSINLMNNSESAVPGSSSHLLVDDAEEWRLVMQWVEGTMEFPALCNILSNRFSERYIYTDWKPVFDVVFMLLEEDAGAGITAAKAAMFTRGFGHLGLKIEELQLRIAGLVKQAGANPTVTEHLDIDCQKTRLDNMIDDFSRKATQYLAEDVLVSQGNTDSDWHDIELGDEPILPLPSNISANQCRDHGVGYLVDHELKL
ncbi:hypothetical protein HYDPIDRAFT_24393 [Hydnomerulius pinastri MD-312]|nr:hypothetical protein HYDPIDRAFT_24393 [Hydnomerulius pinastri MD-312]